MKISESKSARWARILHEQRTSGMSIAEFCRRRDLSTPSFFAWRRRLGPDAVPAFVEVKVGASEQRGNQPDDRAALELQTGGRFRGRILVRPGFDRQALHELLEALEAWA